MSESDQQDERREGIPSGRITTGKLAADQPLPANWKQVGGVGPSVSGTSLDMKIYHYRGFSVHMSASHAGHAGKETSIAVIRHGLLEESCEFTAVREDLVSEMDAMIVQASWICPHALRSACINYIDYYRELYPE